MENRFFILREENEDVNKELQVNGEVTVPLFTGFG